MLGCSPDSSLEQLKKAMALAVAAFLEPWDFSSVEAYHEKLREPRAEPGLEWRGPLLGSGAEVPPGQAAVECRGLWPERLAGMASGFAKALQEFSVFSHRR